VNLSQNNMWFNCTCYFCNYFQQFANTSAYDRYHLILCSEIFYSVHLFVILILFVYKLICFVASKTVADQSHHPHQNLHYPVGTHVLQNA